MTLLLALPMLLLQAAAPAAPKPVNTELDSKEAIALADKVQKFYEKTSDFTADFTQVYEYEGSVRKVKSTGVVKVKKPGLMRWDYNAPEQKLVVLDPHANLYLYIADDKEAQRKKHFSADSLSAAVTFLWGKGKLTDSFRVALAPGKENEPALKLVPKKPEGGFKEIYFTVNAQSGAVEKSLIVDTANNKNTLTFENPKTTPIDKSEFEFTPPKGTHITEIK
jgi:outer membrane lipoprotein carrier protein